MNSIIAGSNSLIVNYYSAYFEMLELPNEHYTSVSIGIKRASVNKDIKNILIVIDSREDYLAYSKLKSTLDMDTQNIILVCTSESIQKLVTGSKVIIFNHKELTLDFTTTLTRMQICKPYMQEVKSEKSPQKVLDYIKFMLVKGNITLPISSECSVNVLKALDQDDISFKVIDNMTKTDPALHSGIIKMANSAYFSGAFSKVEDVERALVRVGLTNVKVFLINFINKSLAANKNLIFSYEISKTIDKSVITASCCYTLAEFYKVCSPVTMFSLCLLSLIGEIFMYAAISDYFSSDGLAGQKPDGYKVMAEQNGRMVSGMLLKKWKFSEEYFFPIMHSAALGANNYMNETKLLHLGQNMLNYYETGVVDDKLKNALTKTELRLSESQLAKLRTDIDSHINSIASVLS
ncbi:MAG: hypothetical protein C0602_02510 [Denitrovibrio sp.]|nr:MAG: hypothetical protein C0602_02510 [Denitrovibrio sp.]